MAELKVIERQKLSLGIATRAIVDLAQVEITEILQSSLGEEKVKKKPWWNVIPGLGSTSNTTKKPEVRDRNNDDEGSGHTDGDDSGATDKKAEEEEMRIATRIQQLTNAVVKLEVLQKEHASSLREIEVIRSLHFKEVFRRFEKIPVADTMSNEWIFDPQKTTFTTWLESQDENDGLYYIFGRVRTSTLL